MKTRIFENEFSYFSWDSFPHVICAQIKLGVPVDIKVLDMAVQLCAERYPYLCRKMERCGEEIKILHNKAPIPVFDTLEAPVLGSDEANGHFLAVSAAEGLIVFDIYHNLTDGLGLTEWIKSVLYEYLILSGHDIPADDIRIPGSAFLPGETDDPFEHMPLDDADEPLYELKPVSGFIMDKRHAEDDAPRNYVIRVSAKELLERSRGRDASPVFVLSYFIKETIKELHPEAKKPFVCGIPHSFRDIAAGEANYRNQDVELSIIYDHRVNAMPEDVQLTAVRGMCILQGDPDNICYRQKQRAEFAASLDLLPTIKERREACRKKGKLIVESPESFAVSYMGRIKWGGIEPFIESIAIYISVLSTPFFVSVYPLDKWFYLTISLNQTSEAYAGKLVELLNKNDIPSEYLYSLKNRLCTMCRDIKQRRPLVDELCIDAKVNNLDEVLEFVNNRLNGAGCPEKVRLQIDIAVEEIFVNIASYAYECDSGCATIKVEISYSPYKVAISFTDDGMPYDPLSRTDPDIDKPIEERPIGGLGIYMVKNTMDDVKYEYKDGHNIFTIVKGL